MPAVESKRGRRGYVGRHAVEVLRFYVDVEQRIVRTLSS